MNARVFVDTNIWIYAKIEKPDSRKHNVAVSFLRNSSERIVISTQVVNEYYSVMVKNRISDPVIKDSLEQLLPKVGLTIISLSTIMQSWKIREKYNYSIYDSLIIASALEADCAILYSEDLQNNQLIENKLRIVNPIVD